MLGSEFKKELTALFKKHGIDSVRMLCYNDPDKVTEYEEELRLYNEQIDKWQVKYDEWVKTNPEVAWPQRYTFTGRKLDENVYNEAKKKYDDWFTKRDAQIGPPPCEPYCDLVKEEYDEEYTPGIWYSSRC